MVVDRPFMKPYWLLLKNLCCFILISMDLESEINDDDDDD